MTLARIQTLPIFQNFITKIARAIPRQIRGKHRVFRKLLSLPAGTHQIELNDGSCILVPDLHEPVAFCSLIDGQYEYDTLALIKNWMQPGGNFIDVGANVGALSLPVAHFLRNKGQVLAIEGSPSIGEYLSTAIKLNGYDNLRMENVLCGEKHSEVDFYQAPESHFGMGSRGEQFDQTPTRLKMQSLDELAASHRPVRAIKVDVEGFEYQVFAGAKKILAEDKPNIVFEFCDWADARNTEVLVGDAQRLLISMGYKIWTLEAYLANKGPLTKPMIVASSMLVAIPGN
jgi:FkbM family methyltransferase